jgi:hypothetical protein
MCKYSFERLIVPESNVTAATAVEVAEKTVHGEHQYYLT